MKKFYITFSVEMDDNATEEDCEEWGAAIIDDINFHHENHPYKLKLIGATVVGARGGGKASTYGV